MAQYYFGGGEKVRVTDYLHAGQYVVVPEALFGKMCLAYYGEGETYVDRLKERRERQDTTAEDVTDQLSPTERVMRVESVPPEIQMIPMGLAKRRADFSKARLAQMAEAEKAKADAGDDRASQG